MNGVKRILVLAQAALLSVCALADTAPAPAIAVIVRAGERHGGIDAERLALIYRRKQQFWNNGQRIYPANLPAQHPLRLQFSLRVLGRRPEALQDYWNDMYYHGVLPPYVLSSQAAMQQFVAATPGAIGYVAYCNVDRTKNIVVGAVIEADGTLRGAHAATPCPH